jgi:hypothetical protein
METKQTEKIMYIENKNITAVEWLIRQQKHNKFFDIEIIEQAKALEKLQIKNAWKADSYLSREDDDSRSEQYYNKTYNK